MNSTIAIAVLAMATACASGHRPEARTATVDDAQAGQAVGHFQYTGRWEHISGRKDGRSAGTSSRSRHAGDTVILPFNGSRVLVYGVRGANGGNAAIAIDGRYYGAANFFAAQKQVRALVFASPPLAEGTHILGLVVNGDPRGSHRAYVNVDGAEVLRQ